MNDIIEAEITSSSPVISVSIVGSGPQGAPGSNGVDGLQGIPGDPGIQGPKGDTGDPGIQGPKGDTGDPGIQGPKGDPGQNGNDGVPGVQGVKGDPFIYSDFTPEQLLSLTGPKGDPGEPGIQGTNGNDGAQGIPGEKGDPFTYSDFTSEQLDGLKGPKGDPFLYSDFTQEQLDGLKGPKGDPGDAGTIASLLTGLSTTDASDVVTTDSIVTGIGKLQAKFKGILTTVRNTVLTGLSTANKTAVIATDSILVAIGKLQAQVSAKVDSVSGKELSTNDYTNTDAQKVSKLIINAEGTAFLADDGTYKGLRSVHDTLFDGVAGTASTIYQLSQPVSSYKYLLVMGGVSSGAGAISALLIPIEAVKIQAGAGGQYVIGVYNSGSNNYYISFHFETNNSIGVNTLAVTGWSTPAISKIYGFY